MDRSIAHTGNPYPPLQISGPNPAAGRAMQDNVGSANSEMSAVSLYVYNSIVTEPTDRLVSETFHAIMLVEMKHLDMFATLALMLGMDPRLWSQQRRKMVYWTPRFNQYPTEREALLENAMRGELAAIEQYKQQMATIQDRYIQAVLARVIEDEQLHVDMFAALMEGRDPAMVRQPPRQSGDSD